MPTKRNGNSTIVKASAGKLAEMVGKGIITSKQGQQLAVLAGNAFQRTLQNYRNQKQSARPQMQAISQKQAIMRMPHGMGRGRGYDYEDFKAQTTKQLLHKAWSLNPATSNLMAPRGAGYYDAFNMHPVTSITAMTIGPATPIIARASIPSAEVKQLNTGINPNGKPAYYGQLLIIGPSNGNAQGNLYYRNDVDTELVQSIPLTAEALPDQKEALFGDPQTSTNVGASYLLPGGDLAEVIPTRCSVRIRNFTSEVNRGGQVFILRMTAGTSLGPDRFTTNKQFSELCDGIRQSGRTVPYEGCDFAGEGLQKNCTVADQSASLAFRPFNQAVCSTTVNWAPDKCLPTSYFHPGEEYPIYPFTNYLYNPTMTPIAILFEPFVNVMPTPPTTPGTVATGNTYGITVQSQFLAHYKQGTMLSNLAFTPSLDKGNTLARHIEKEGKTGSAMHKILEKVIPLAAPVVSGMLAF